MRLIGFYIGILVTCWFFSLDTPGDKPLNSETFIKKENSQGAPSVPFHDPDSPVLWTEVNVLRRKQRPYRNPLRRLRKQLFRKRRKRDWSLHINEDESGSELEGSGKKVTNIAEEDEDSVEEVETVKEFPQKSKRGKPSEIPTDHVFCPNKDCKGYHVLGPHPDHWIVGAGPYKTKWGERRQMYECKHCKKTFSETRGTVFFGLKTPQKTIYQALNCLAEGMGIRATARVYNVKPDTVLLWLRRAGQHCEKVSTYLMKNLKVKQVQLDELWTFVFKKEKTLSAWEKLHSEYGDTWIWTALDPTHKLVLALVVGGHEEKEAVSVLQKVKAVLIKNCLPLFLSDQLPHYAQALLKVFGRWFQPERKGERGRYPHAQLEPPEGLNYATVNKSYEKNGVKSVSTRVVFGTAKEVFKCLKEEGMKKINTSFVERMNLTLRHLVSRLRRKGLTFSKKREYLKWHLQLSVAYYHFVRPHRGLRRRLAEPVPTKGNGSPKIWEKRTPALSAGLTDHIWSIQELLTYRVPEISPIC